MHPLRRARDMHTCRDEGVLQRLLVGPCVSDWLRFAEEGPAGGQLSLLCRLRRMVLAAAGAALGTRLVNAALGTCYANCQGTSTARPGRWPVAALLWAVAGSGHRLAQRPSRTSACLAWSSQPVLTCSCFHGWHCQATATVEGLLAAAAAAAVIATQAAGPAACGACTTR